MGARVCGQWQLEKGGMGLRGANVIGIEEEIEEASNRI